MSKRNRQPPDLNKTPSQKRSNAIQSQPSSASNAGSKKFHSYTPNWLTPKEKALLKARVQQIKTREKRMTKEEIVLLQASKKSSKESSPGSDMKKSSVSKESTPGSDMKKSSVSSIDSKKGGKLKKSKSDKSLKSDKSSLNFDDDDDGGGMKKKKSNESVKKQKSKEAVRDGVDSKKSGKETHKDSGKKKSKEDLRMSKKYEEAHGKHPNEEKEEKESHIKKSSRDLNDHLWATDYAHFDPQLYHFKSPEKLSTKNPVLAECPPFWVLLDHTIAITWKLFCPDAERRDLGIIPLQWSREFVSAMRDERGEYLPATGQLLSAIEDALIDRYAKATDADRSEELNQDDDGQISKKDCKKGKNEDSLSYVSSESIFKYPIEVSYTLKDIMSRNMPGRKLGEGESGGVQAKTDTAVSKTEVPPPEDHETMSKTDMLNYLKQLKQEQDLRVEQEKERSEKIDVMMELLAKGKVDYGIWSDGAKRKHSEKEEHVHFDEHSEDAGHITDKKGTKSQKGDKDKGKAAKVSAKEEGKKGKEAKEKHEKKQVEHDKKAKKKKGHGKSDESLHEDSE